MAVSPGKHYRSGGRWLELVIIVVVALLAVGGGLAGYLIGKGKEEGKETTTASKNPKPNKDSEETIFVPAFTKPIPKGKNLANGWELTLGISKSKFRRGEMIDFKLSMKNVSEEERSLSFSSLQKYDLEAYDADGNKVWQWSADQAFAAMLSEETFKPGEKKDFSVFWSQQSLSKKQVLLGKYFIVGYITASEVNMEKVVVEIVVAEQ